MLKQDYLLHQHTIVHGKKADHIFKKEQIEPCPDARTEFHVQGAIQWT